jgi:ArsR family transcriptional regulator
MSIVEHIDKRQYVEYDVSMVQVLSLSRSPKHLATLADQYKALGDETRLGLMLTVAASEGSEACVCDLTPGTGLAQSTVSHHLRLLVDAGLLDRTQRGKWAYFSLTPAAKKLLK